MRVPLGWLSEWVDLPESREELERRLTVGGLEIEGVERTGPDLSAIRVGRVVERGPHPNADRLSFCRVDIGEGDPLEIVCGAPNVAADQKVAVAVSGTVLPDGTKLKKSKIRGVTSNGMICSARELGLGDEHDGILVLDAGAPVGEPLDRVLDGGEVVLDVEITPNRGDWISLLGMARETRAQFGGELRLPETEPSESTRAAADDITISIQDADGCFAYVGRVVRGIRMGPSPDWMQARLEAAGLRPINVVVDVTNYVLLELGQPLHAFDLSTLRGGEIRVRSASAGEKIDTLDGETRELSPDDLVIADAERAIAIAGVMGGADTEVRDHTTDILIESAHFAPVRVRRTARRLGLRTEASYRFERGVDRDGIRRAADRAARLISELAGGTVSQGVVEARGSGFPFVEEVRMHPEHANRLLGTRLSPDQVIELLARVDIQSEPDATGELVCRIPSYRNDLAIPADLIEEVARIYGYDRIPTSMPVGALEPVEQPPRIRIAERARDALRGLGLTEIRVLPWIGEADLDALRLPGDDPRRAVVRTLNPIVDGEALLRPTLVPSLLRCAQHNLARQLDQIRIFELSPVFLRRGDGELPDEPLCVAGLVVRGERSSIWDPADPPELFFEAKGIVERLLDDLGTPASFEAVPGGADPFLHPGASARVVHAGQA
ncbi:MAG: phenylalanine--tRNA ligase subunit beta, partial [Deltaproteobacteria bacterium]|nr:phenylalanine--tRNA ligase subunit beta [Deltaproteobacteria bacterium]